MDPSPPGVSASPAPLGERVTTLIDEGEYAGTSARVDQIVAWPLFALASARYQRFLEADTPETELTTLQAMCKVYESRARPVWTVEDLRGPVPATAVDMLLRVPVPLIESLFVMWISSFPQPEPVAED